MAVEKQKTISGANKRRRQGQKGTERKVDGGEVKLTVHLMSVKMGKERKLAEQKRPFWTV